MKFIIYLYCLVLVYNQINVEEFNSNNKIDTNTNTLDSGLKIKFSDDLINTFILGTLNYIFLAKNNTFFLDDEIRINKTFPFLGGIEFGFKNISILVYKNINNSTSIITNINSRNESINLNIKDINFIVYFDYEFNSEFYITNGKGILNLFNISFDTEFQIETFPLNKSFIPYIKFVNIKFISFNSELSLTSKGKIESIFEYLISGLNTTLISVFNDDFQYRDNIITTINKAINNYIELSSSSILYLSKYQLFIDISLVEKVIFNRNSLFVSPLLEIYDRNNRSSEFNSTKMNQNESENEIIEVLISSKLVNDILYSFISNNLLNFTLSHDETIYLNTTSFYFIDQMKTRYTNNSFPMKTLISINKYFPTQLKLNKIVFESRFICQFDVIIDNFIETAFILEFHMLIRGDFIVKNGILKGNLDSLLLIDLNEIKGGVIELDINSIKTGFDNIFSLLTTIVNSLLEEEKLKIPNFGKIKFDETNIVIEDNYIRLDFIPILI